MDRDTSDYSPTESPETRAEAEEPDSFSDTRLIPGGAQPRSNTPQGMDGLDRKDVPGLDDDRQRHDQQRDDTRRAPSE